MHLPGKRTELDAVRPHSEGWSFISLVTLIVAALAAEYLVLSNERHNIASSGGSDGLANDGEHGRLANTPLEIPARGWKDILLRMYSNISTHRIMALAAGMTYYSLLAIFPRLPALVALFGIFADPFIFAKAPGQLGGGG